MSNEEKKRLLEQILAEKAEGGHCCTSGHCWHLKRGAIWMVVKDGHVVQECCRCPATRSVHGDHALDKERERRDDFKLGIPEEKERWKLYAGGPLAEGWTSDFGYERGREAQKFRC